MPYDASCPRCSGSVVVRVKSLAGKVKASAVFGDVCHLSVVTLGDKVAHGR